MGERISISEAARRLDKAKNSVLHQIRRGNFAPGPDGKLDWDDVQANYITERPAANPEATRREQTARVTSAVVKANFGKVRLAHIERSYTERSVSRETLLNEVDDLLARIRRMPATAMRKLAADFELDEAEAGLILRRVTDIALEELGDIRADAERIVENV